MVFSEDVRQQGTRDLEIKEGVNGYTVRVCDLSLMRTWVFTTGDELVEFVRAEITRWEGARE